MNPGTIENTLGQRGLNPALYPNQEYWGLFDAADGTPIRIDIREGVPFWNEAALGPQPSAEELTLASTPKISLGVANNGAGDGLIFTATLTDAPDATVTNWRLIAPDGGETLTNGETLAGADAWEIETNDPGTYKVQVWADGYGWAELSAEGV